MKITEVVAHMEFYKPTKFFSNSDENNITHLMDGPFIRGRWMPKPISIIYVWSFSTSLEKNTGTDLHTIYQIIGGVLVVAALLNIAKIYLLYLVHLKIKEEDEQMRNQMANWQMANAQVSNSVQPIQSWS